MYGERMNIVVTGGLGYIGSVLIPQLIKEFPNDTITVVDNVKRGGYSLTDKIDKVDFLNLDLTTLNFEDKYEVFEKADVVIHLAGLVGFPACAKAPQESYDLNSLAINIISRIVPEECHILFASTTSVYGDINNAKEFMDCKPESIYGQHKLDGENALSMNHERYTIFRFATAFGLSPNYRTDLLPHTLVRQAIKDNAMVVFEPQAIRSFIHVRDMASLFIQAIKKQRYGVYNACANSNQISKLELANLISKYTGAKVFAGDFKSDPEKRLNPVCFDVIKNHFNITISIEQGIQELVSYHSLLKEYVFI